MANKHTANGGVLEGLGKRRAKWDTLGWAIVQWLKTIALRLVWPLGGAQRSLAFAEGFNLAPDGL
ncbi:hypothetical protein KFZ76_19175, partial [Methylovulum psychrotolerans]|uniref:hypothetical protein n=1 Tax=Methylovulum psychrotolerans TaxID=1704499 RepID=UPI001BFF35ED